MSITPPALRATSPFFDRGGAANALLAESNKLVQFAKLVNKKKAESETPPLPLEGVKKNLQYFRKFFDEKHSVLF